MLPSIQWKGTFTLARLLTITDPYKKVPLALEMIFPEEYLNAKAEGDSENRTYREVQAEVRKTYSIP